MPIENSPSLELRRVVALQRKRLLKYRGLTSSVIPRDDEDNQISNVSEEEGTESEDMENQQNGHNVRDERQERLSVIELHKRQAEVKRKIRSNWEAMLERLSQYSEDDQGDVLDLATLEIIEDKGHLKSLAEKRENHIWHENFDDDREKRSRQRVFKARVGSSQYLRPTDDDLMLVSPSSGNRDSSDSCKEFSDDCTKETIPSSRSSPITQSESKAAVLRKLLMKQTKSRLKYMPSERSDSEEEEEEGREEDKKRKELNKTPTKQHRKVETKKVETKNFNFTTIRDTAGVGNDRVPTNIEEEITEEAFYSAPEEVDLEEEKQNTHSDHSPHRLFKLTTPIRNNREHFGDLDSSDDDVDSILRKLSRLSTKNSKKSASGNADSTSNCAMVSPLSKRVSLLNFNSPVSSRKRQSLSNITQDISPLPKRHSPIKMKHGMSNLLVDQLSVRLDKK